MRFNIVIIIKTNSISTNNNIKFIFLNSLFNGDSELFICSIPLISMGNVY